MATEMVYVIGSPRSPLVKIGRSTNVAKRLEDIQRMSPVRLQVRWSTEGGHRLELALHQQFKKRRRHGEWFDFSGADPVAEISAAVEVIRARWAAKEQAPGSVVEPASPKLARNRNWREWTRVETRMVRISDADWADYAAVCAAEGTTRAADVRARIDSRIDAYRRKNPGVQLPSDATGYED